MGEGQAELFVAPQERSLIVPAGHGCWWGVDSSTSRVAIGTVTADGLRGSTLTVFPKVSGLERLDVIYRETRAAARELAGLLPPGLVFVEQPSGSNQKVNRELEFAVGTIAAAVLGGAAEACGFMPHAELVVGAHWKSVACGAGNIYKTMRVAGRKRPVPVPLEEYGVMRWARAQGYVGVSWDEADAWGIAECARRDVGLVQR